jgi:transposase
MQYPKLKELLQNIKYQENISCISVAQKMGIHKNVVYSWFNGLRFPRAASILPLCNAIYKNQRKAKKLAFKILEISQ